MSQFDFHLRALLLILCAAPSKRTWKQTIIRELAKSWFKVWIFVAVLAVFVGDYEKRQGFMQTQLENKFPGAIFTSILLHFQLQLQERNFPKIEWLSHLQELCTNTSSRSSVQNIARMKKLPPSKLGIHMTWTVLCGHDKVESVGKYLKFTSRHYFLLP